MKKLMIYPYDKEATSIARNRKLLKEYELVSIVALKGWGYREKDGSELDGGSEIGIAISEEFQTELENCEVVLFLDGNNEISLKTYIDKINLANKMGRKILTTKNLRDRLGLEKSSSLDFEIIDDNDVDYELLCKKNNKVGLYKFKTPIIMIYGTGEYCNKFDIQLALREQFIKDGYKVSQVGTKEYSTLFGFSKIPEFIYTQELTMEDKVFAFNKYIHFLETTEKPDVFIIGVPGGIMSICDKCTNKFGELANIISNAVQADIGILSLYYNKNINERYLKELKLYCKYVLKCCIDYFNLANTQYNIEGELERVTYFTEKSINIRNYMEKNEDIYRENDLNVINILSPEYIEYVYINIINELSNGVYKI